MSKKDLYNEAAKVEITLSAPIEPESKENQKASSDPIFSDNADFKKTSSPAQKKSKGVTGTALIEYVLRITMAASMGADVQNVRFVYIPPTDDQDQHCFRLLTKNHLMAHDEMSADERSRSRHRVRNKTESFLHELDEFLDDDKGRVMPRQRTIFVENRLILMNAIRDCIENYCGEELGFPVISLAEQTIPEEFGNVQFNKRQVHQEFAAAIGENIEKGILENPEYAFVLLQSAYTKSYQNLNEYYAYAGAVFQNIPPDVTKLANILFLTEQLIRHEDSLDEERDDGFFPLYQPLRLSIN